MIDLTKFKPDLIDNFDKKVTENSAEAAADIAVANGIENYMIFFKKDGARLQLLKQQVLGRSLKLPQSKLIIDRFQPLTDLCAQLNITADGEFYSHEMKFNEIMRFWKCEDVTIDKEVVKWTKAKAKGSDLFPGRSVEWLTTFHEDLKFWLFDGLILDRPDMVRFEDRIFEIMRRISQADEDLKRFITFPQIHHVKNRQELMDLYEYALELGYEGLVLVHKDHQYKFGRNSNNVGTILKMKDDSIEYDGVILDVLEGDMVKDDVERTTNELGRSVTSKKKADRIPSGLAKGFLVQYEEVGTFPVGLSGFDNEAKRELLQNKEKYIGRHFRYKGMPPVKDFPRSVYFESWRDTK